MAGATDFLVVKNRAYSKLAAAITIDGTTLTVTAGDGAKFPSTYPFHLTIEDEIVSCTSRTTDSLTVVRAQQGTSAAAHANKTYVALNITAKSITDLNTAVNFIEKYADYGLAFYGVVTTYTDTTHFKVSGLAGLGTGWFKPAAGAPYEIFVVQADAAAPEGESQPVAAYASADGTFQHSAFSVPIAVGDEVLILIPLIASLGTKATAAASGAVTTTDYAIAYIKQIINELLGTDGAWTNLSNASIASLDAALQAIGRVLAIDSTNEFSGSLDGSARTTIEAMWVALGVLLGTRDATATADDLSDITTTSALAKLRRLLLRFSSGAFTVTMDGSARTDIAAMMTALSDIFTASGAAFSVSLDGSARTDLAALHTALGVLVGTRADAAATGAVTDTDSAMKYIKQLVTELQALDVLVDAIKAVTDVIPDAGALTALLASIASILEDTETTLPATLATIASYIDTEVQIIIDDLANATDGLGALKALIDAVQADVGNPTGETLPSISTKIGDIARSLDVIIGARWDSSGDLGTDIAQLLTYTDILDNATNGLAAIKAEVEGLGGEAMRGTDSAALASAWTAALATALGNYTATRAGYLDELAAANLPTDISTIDTVVDGIQTDLSNVTDGLGALKTAILANATLIGALDATATADDLSDIATTDVSAKVRRLLLRFSSDAFTATIQGGAQTALDTMLAQLAIYFAAGGAALSVVSQPGVAARTNLNDILTDLADILAGTSGITHFPARALPADTVSLAEVHRYIAEVKPGWDARTSPTHTTTGTTEETILTTSSTTPGLFYFNLTLRNMVAGDDFTIRVYKRVDGSNYDLKSEQNFIDAPLIKVYEIEGLYLDATEHIRVTIQRNSGTNRAFPYSYNLLRQPVA